MKSFATVPNAGAGPADARPSGVVMVMLSPGRGGLEQSLLDYAEVLCAAGHRVSVILRPEWPDRERLSALPLEISTLRPLGDWDPLAVWRLRRQLRGLSPAVVLTIGRRPGVLVRRALRRLPGIAHVAQTPNYSIRRLIGIDHVIATTGDIREALIAAGQLADAITVIPNMIRVPKETTPPPGGAVPVIGALGRFVEIKGFADLIAALALLRDRGQRFEAVIGGSGPEESALREQVGRLDLGERVRFVGWVGDKAAFFAGIDLFCVPSRREAFGIVVLEGMAHGRATVATATPGPRAILADGTDGLLVPSGDAEALADALARLLEDPALRARLAAAGHATVLERYDQRVVGPRISKLLERVARGAPEASSAAHQPFLDQERRV